MRILLLGAVTVILIMVYATYFYKQHDDYGNRLYYTIPLSCENDIKDYFTDIPGINVELHELSNRSGGFFTISSHVAIVKSSQFNTDDLIGVMNGFLDECAPDTTSNIDVKSRNLANEIIKSSYKINKSDPLYMEYKEGHILIHTLY